MESLFAILIIIIVLLYRINSSKIKGAIGESIIADKLKRLPYEEYKVFNDVLIKTSRGSSQIDHIVISIYGIFVIETKNYNGWIHGHENSEYWTQTIYKKKNKFRNPIKQNWAHIYALKEVLSDFEPITYHPVVVFTHSAEFKNLYTKTPVIYLYQLLDTLTDGSRIPQLSIKEIDIIKNRLNEIVIFDKQARKEHIHQVKNQTYERIRKENSLECPRCGGALVVRNGQYGKFYGCSNYPKCKYTRNF